MHPIFNALKYPLYRTEADRLYRLLYEQYDRSEEISDFYDRCGPGLPKLYYEDTPDIVWRNALDGLASRSKLPCLCENLLNVKGLHDDLRQAIAAVIAAPPAVDQHFVLEEIMILDRLTLRELLKLLQEDRNPAKIVLVRGSRQSGKTHCRHLFEQVAADKDEIPVYIAEGMVATLDEVLTYLFAALEQAPSAIPARVSSEDAWYRSVSAALYLAAKKTHRTLWIAIDDLGPADDGSPLIDPEIKKFFDQFVMQMPNPDFRKHFRLMLIHYPDGPVPSKWNTAHWKDCVTRETDVEQKHIKEALLSWCKMKGLRTPEDDIELKAQNIVTAVDSIGQPPPGATGPSRLSRINQAVADAIQELSKQRP